MHDQADGLRQKRKDMRILSVLNLPDQPDSTAVAWRFALAWSRMGARPLLVDGTGKSADRLLGCHPLLEWIPVADKALADCVLMQEGRAAVVAKGLPGGDSGLLEQATRLGYRDLIFDAGELGPDDVPLDAETPQDVCLLAAPDRVETVYALLKALQQAQSPARTWLLWQSASPEARRLTQVCSQRLGRLPHYLGDQIVSNRGQDSYHNGAKSSLHDNDIRSILVTMLADHSLRGEETPSSTERHA